MNPALPARVWIVGCPGSGKSSLATRLGERVGVTPTHLDDQFWLPEWREREVEEFRRRVAEVVTRDRWIIDGNYRAVRGTFLPQADLVIWLDLDFWLVVSRVVRRTIRRSRSRESICNGNHESLLRSIFLRDSIIWWTVTQHRRYRRSYAGELVDRPYVRLRNPAEVERWIESIEGGVA